MFHIFLFPLLKFLLNLQSVVGQEVSFGHQLSPTVFLDLEVSNHTDTKCVTINRREFCSTIHYCPLAAYQCNYVDGTGYECGFSPPLCSCSATWGPDDCDCYVSVMGAPYWVSTSVQCTSPSPYLEVDPGTADCSDKVGDVCVRGVNTFEIFNEDNDGGFIQVTWQCPKEQMEDHSACECKALQSYKECSSCKVCGDGEIGDFALECNGFSMDCNSTIQISHYVSKGGSRFSAHLAILATGGIVLFSLLS